MKGTLIRSTLTLRALTLRKLTVKSDLQGLGLAPAIGQRRSFGSAAEAIYDDIHEEKNVEKQQKIALKHDKTNPNLTEFASSEFKSGFKVDLKAMEKQETIDPEFWQRQNKAKWWHPDPVSGVWVPEDKFGSVDSAQLREQRLRNSPRASMDERAWWSSLEELPDEYDRPTRSRR